MTDNEIIKVFDCCYADKPCKQCPCYTDYKCTLPNDEADLIPRKIVDLINRQKAEIEGLQKRISGQKHAIFEQQSYTAELQKQLKTAEARAIKEFAERLCEGRVPNDPVAIAVKVELDEYKEKRGLI